MWIIDQSKEVSGAMRAEISDISPRTVGIGEFLSITIIDHREGDPLLH